eukprot:1187895-Prorocentrum_minimum.AAC.3
MRLHTLVRAAAHVESTFKTDARHHHRAGGCKYHGDAPIPAEGGLQEARELAVAVRDVLIAPLAQLRDHRAQGQQALVDVRALPPPRRGKLVLRERKGANNVRRASERVTIT